MARAYSPTRARARATPAQWSDTPHVGGGPPSSPWRGLEREDDEQDVGSEHDLAVDGQHRAAGGLLDLARELGVLELLELQAQVAHELCLAALDERALDRRQGLFEEAEDELVLQIRLRSGRSLAPVLAGQPDQRVRD